MKNLSMFLIAFLNLLLFACCTKEEPCPTCFENVVTCKINGKEWQSNCVSNDPLFGCRAVTTHFYMFDNNYLELRAANSQLNSHISINKPYVILGNNKIDPKNFRILFFDNQGNCSRLDSVDLKYNNSLEIELIDTINFIIEGRFQFRNYNLCGDTAVVTDGYFKTKFIF